MVFVEVQFVVIGFLKEICFKQCVFSMMANGKSVALYKFFKARKENGTFDAVSNLSMIGYTFKNGIWKVWELIMCMEEHLCSSLSIYTRRHILGYWIVWQKFLKCKNLAYSTCWLWLWCVLEVALQQYVYASLIYFTRLLKFDDKWV